MRVVIGLKIAVGSLLVVTAVGLGVEVVEVVVLQGIDEVMVVRHGDVELVDVFEQGVEVLLLDDD